MRFARGWRALLVIALSIGRADAGSDQAKRPAAAAQEFTERVAQYVRLQRKLAAEQPPMRKTQNAQEIKTRQRTLAKALQRARPRAAPGDFFTTSVAAYFRQVIHADATETGTKIGADPPDKPKVSLRVNDEYPGHEPLSSVPPVLLSRLPQLPEELEYRFVGQHLLLRDRKANLIVDFLPNAGPPSR